MYRKSSSSSKTNRSTVIACASSQTPCADAGCCRLHRASVSRESPISGRTAAVFRFEPRPKAAKGRRPSEKAVQTLAGLRGGVSGRSSETPPMVLRGPRIEDVPQPIAEEIEAEDGDGDRRSRKEREPGREHEEVLGILEHETPRGLGRLRSEAEVRE